MSHDSGLFRAAVDAALADEAEKIAQEAVTLSTGYTEVAAVCATARVALAHFATVAERVLVIDSMGTGSGVRIVNGHHRAATQAGLERILANIQVAELVPQVTHGPNHVADVRMEEKYRKAEAKRARREQIKRNGGKR